MLSRDLYAILGVSADASDEEIETAYLHLSRRYHPRINPGDAEAALAFERIEAAFHVLGHPARRAEYDRASRSEETRGAGARPAGDSSVADRPQSDISVDAAEGSGGSFHDLFRALRDHARRSGPQRGENLHTTLSIPLPWVELGRRTALEVKRLIVCQRCSGRGRLPGGASSPCQRCQGTGNEIFSKGALSVTCTCADCGGEGRQRGSACPQCHGSGLMSSVQAIPVQAPAGVVDGQVIRLPGLGHHGPKGGPPGDLLITCQVQAQPGFERQGPNLHCTVRVAVAEAVLGARIPVPVPDGPDATLRLPPGTQNGQLFRMRGRGLPMGGGRHGDLLITVELWVPELVDEDAKALISQFHERTGAPPRSASEHVTVKS
jgi:molecular chaperone DnaJ